MIYPTAYHASILLRALSCLRRWSSSHIQVLIDRRRSFYVLLTRIHLPLWISMFILFYGHIFTALHEMQTRSSDENSVRLSVCLSVCPSVRPSVTRVYCDKTVERSVQIYIPYERTFSLVFWEEEWLVEGDLFYVKFWVNRPPLERNRRLSTNNRS